MTEILNRPTGEFLCDTEQIVSLMRSIIMKLVTDAPIANLCGDLIQKLNRIMELFRWSACQTSLMFLPGPMLSVWIENRFEKDWTTVIDILLSIKTRSEQFSCGDPEVQLNLQLLMFLGVMIEELTPSGVQIRKTVLNEITSEWKMLTMMQVTEIFISCYGEIAKKCGGCLKDIVPMETVFFPLVGQEQDLKNPICFLDFVSKTVMFLCGQACCLLKEEALRRNKAKNLVTQVTFYADGCDFCFKQSTALHRCNKCKTKYYCGIECMNKDWELIHKKICGKGDIERKKKGGTKIRREEMNDKLDKAKPEILANLE